MLSTNEMVEFLGNTYNLEVTRDQIFQYANKGLLTPEKRRVGLKGKGNGVKTYWGNSTPRKIYGIKELLKQNFKLAEIAKYCQMLKQEYLILDELELAKYNRVTKYFSEAEVTIS